MGNIKVASSVLDKDNAEHQEDVSAGRLRFVKCKNIDRKKWDACISSAYNSIVYSYSWYLDLVCGRWDAIVEDDYAAVMPLPSNTKYFITYVYQPFFCQQLGVFSSKKLDADRLHKFVDAVYDKFIYAEFNLNIFNFRSDFGSNASERVSYQLDLSPAYDRLNKFYHINTKRNIRKAASFNHQINKSISSSDFCRFVFDCWEFRSIDLPSGAKSVLERLITVGLEYGFIDLYTVAEAGLTTAAVALLKSGYKIIMLVSAANEQARQSRAMFALIDHVIKNNCGNPMVLDFEGSMIPDVAFFYKGFGAMPACYNRIEFSKLPLGLKKRK